MGVTAREIMETEYYTVHPDTSVPDAVAVFKEAAGKLNRRVFGLMVVNDRGELVGMLSMYDILVLMRPKHISIWGEMSHIDVSGFVREALDRCRSIRVGDLMTTDVITVTPDTHLLLIVNIMTRKHIRRIPVIEGGKVIGVVHISNVVFHLMERPPREAQPLGLAAEMPGIEFGRMLGGLKVRDVMRWVTVHIPVETSIGQAIRSVIKHKVNAALAVGEHMEPLGVVSRTDMMGAYYAGIDIESPVRFIMSTPPVFCSSDDTLEDALETMREKGLNRLYIRADTPLQDTGVLSYPDIVGLLYRYCHRCRRNIGGRFSPDSQDLSHLLKVREVMTQRVKVLDENESLMRVMEELSERGFGILLITRGGLPAGVISKTDLVLAFQHGVPPIEKARTIMRSPVRSFSREADLAQATRAMIFGDMQRLFVHGENPDDIVGVLSLADLAQARSGSCRACIASRIDVL